MRGRAPAVWALAAAAALLGCSSVTWRELGPNEPARTGMVEVTGSLHFEPPLELQRRGVLLVGPMADHVLTYFSETLEGSFDPGENPPFPGATTAWLPMEGPFAVELPPKVRYLRGYAYASNLGSVIELPVRLDLRPGDTSVEVGAITVVRTPPRKIIVRPNRPGSGPRRAVRLADPGL